MSKPTPLTHQQLFDNALNGMRRQRYHRSRSHGTGDCLYFGHYGRRCAVGHSIPDDWRSCVIDDFNKTSIERLIAQTDGLGGLIPSDDHTVALLRQLQATHDFCLDDAKVFENRMAALAAEFGLHYTHAPESATA